MTKFADLTLEEYKATALTKITRNTNTMDFDNESAAVEAGSDVVNWVTKGAVTPVKD
jgi:hypothetical protein